MKNPVATSLSLACMLLIGLLLRPLLVPATAQTQPASAAGRYTLAFQLGTPYFMDTQTGKLWAQTSFEQPAKGGEIKMGPLHWVEIDSPVNKAGSQER